MGDLFNPQALPEASRTLPFRARVRLFYYYPVTGWRLAVRINDCRPSIVRRQLDVLERAAEMLAFESVGVVESVTKILR